MRGVWLSLGLVSAVFFACSSSDSEPVSAGGAAGVAGKPAGGSAGNGFAGASGEGGEGGSGVSGSPDEAGAAGAAGARGPSVCVEDAGKGDIELIVEGLPASIAASITISGPHEALESESTTLSDVPGGAYSVSAKRVYDADPLVRTAYDAQVSSPTFCLEEGGSHVVTVTYSKVTPSNQLWTLVRSHGGALQRGFASSLLGTSGSPEPTLAAFLPIEGVMAFDRAGDLWGAKSSPETGIVRYAPTWLAGVGEALADYDFKLALDQCVPPTVNSVSVPQIKAIALDASENVWLSVCDRKVIRINRPDSSPASSEEPEDIVPAVTLSGFTKQPEDLAFDGVGNLWVTAGGQVLRFDRARLDTNDSRAPDLVLDVTTDDASPVALPANFLAFDIAGNLWAADGTGPRLFEVAKTNLDRVGTSSAAAKVQLTLDSASILARPAFDDEGSLWVSLALGFGKLTAQQLAVSSAAPVAPSILIRNTGEGPDSLAFFPTTTGSSLASSQP